MSVKNDPRLERAFELIREVVREANSVAILKLIDCILEEYRKAAAIRAVIAKAENAGKEKP